LESGYEELLSVLYNKNVRSKNIEKNSKLYNSLVFAVPLYVDFIIGTAFYLNCKKIFWMVFLSVAIWVPISEIFIRIMNYILGKFKKPIFIPKMDYENKIPDDKKTIIVIPTILKNEKKVKEMVKKLEVYYLANKQDNLYFALLGDVSEEDVQRTNFDDEVMSSGINEIEKLNEKYKTNGFNKFHFLYRKRVWNDREGKFIGWERKRGLLATFNKYIKNLIPNDFEINTIEEQKELLPDFKYVITLDSDTNLVFNSASKMIGAMSHILNTPIIEDRKVISGYGIMQPRVGLDLGLAQKSDFVKLYASQGGIDFYTNAISDIYQDYFKEGIFTGKGIYDIYVYNEILENEIPENTVLSHDLLEGNFLRCALLTDCMLLDGYPEKYLSYISRNHRWVRGDWQIVSWLKSKRLNRVSKFKIFDNLRRSLLKVFAFVGVILSFIFSFENFKFSLWLLILSIFSITIMYFLDIVNYIVFKESNIYGAVYSKKKFAREVSGIPLDFLKIFLEVIFLPFEAWENLDAIIRSFYRMTKKKKLLEWTTSEDGEKIAENTLFSNYKKMWINILARNNIFNIFKK
jgi:hypothetical protein